MASHDEWDGGNSLANLFDGTAVRASYGTVFASLTNSKSGRRVSVELTPGEAMLLARYLNEAARTAICAQSLYPGTIQ